MASAMLSHQTFRLGLSSGALGFLRTIYTAFGGKCEPNHINNLKSTLRDMAHSLLRFVEIQDIVTQFAHLQNRQLVGYNDLPQSVIAAVFVQT